MAHSTTSRRFYIDIDGSDEHAVVRRVPVHKSNWDAGQSSASVAQPANPQAQIAPRRLGLVLQTMRKRQPKA